MDYWLIPSVVATIAGSALLTVIYAYIYLNWREKHIGVWTCAWGLMAISYLLTLASIQNPYLKWLIFGSQVTTLVSGLLIVWGTVLFLGAKDRFRPLLGIVCVTIVSIWVVFALFNNLPPLWLHLPTYMLLGGMYIWMGWMLLRRPGFRSMGRNIAGATFIAWGLHKAGYPYIQFLEWFDWGYYLSAAFEIVAAIGVLLWYFEEAANRLSESESRYRSLFVNNHAVMLLIDPDSGDIVSANPAACAFYGYSKEELESKRISDINTLSPDEMRQRMADAREGRQNYFVFSHRLASGEVRDVEVYSGPIEVGGRTLLHSLIHDITERKLVEQALRTSEERLQLVFSAIQDGFWDWDVEKDETFASGGWLALLDFDPAEVGKSLSWWRQLIHPEDVDRVVGAFREHLAGRTERYEVEFRLQTKSGEWKWILSRGKVVKRTDDGRPLRVVGAHTDISERKYLQRQLEQSQRLEMVGRLAGGIAHDFNNLLTAIIGYSEFVLSDLEPDSPAHQDVEEIKKAADRAASLASQLLVFSRQQSIEPQVISLNDLVFDMDKMLRRLIGENVELVAIPAADLWPIDADPSQLEQVLVNLTVNARDAMPDGGTITISTRNVLLEDEILSRSLDIPCGEYVLLTVADQGIGISAEVREHLFEPFFTTKAKGKGTGLGLATAYGIIKRHKGAIGVESELGRGSTFSIYLPRSSKQLPPQIVQAGEGHLTRGSETILLVEDEPSVRTVAARIMRGLGYVVLIASNGEEALRLLQSLEKPVDLLFTDIVMPQMGGWELGEKVQEKWPEVKILYSSGYTNGSSPSGGSGSNAINFLPKPFTADTLAHKVRQVLDSR